VDESLSNFTILNLICRSLRI